MSKNVIPHILIVEEQEPILASFSENLKRQGFQIKAATSLEDIEIILQDYNIFASIVSMELHQEDFVDLIYEISDLNPAGIVLTVASEASARMTTVSLEAGAKDYFLWPIQDWGRFRHILRQSQQLWAEQLELQELRKSLMRMRAFRSNSLFDDIKGSSPAIQELFSQIEAVAPLDVTTLVFGESGVGKELVARAIHNQSNRREENFVAVNCAAISPELFESELFGHRKGSFTGAAQHRQGFCAAAAGGTLFLDEIGELPLKLQPKLLRLLEQWEYRPVGSDRVEKFAGRVVAATNVDLDSAVKKGGFREDLYFRLSVQELYVPPLRKRKGDIKLLSYHFLERYNREYGKNINRIHPRALILLEEYDWRRNNVRELEREIQRGMVRSAKGDTILRSESLFWHHGRQILPIERMWAMDEDEDNDKLWLELPYSDAMSFQRRKALKTYLEYHLTKAKGKKSQAAMNCGIQPANFSRLLREIDD